MGNSRIGTSWGKQGKYLLLALFIVFAVVFAINFDVTALETFVDKYDKFIVAISLLTYVILGVTIIPSEPVTILMIALKGPFTAILLATLGNTLAAVVEFYIGGSISDITDFEKKKEKLPFHLGKLPINSPAFLILARMIPGFGPKFVSIVSGIYRVPMLTYLWTSVVAHLIGAIFIVLGGYGIMKIFD